MTGMEARNRHKLEGGLAPVRLEIVDESDLHAGHAEAPAEGGSHFRVTVVAGVFTGLSRVERQRLVYGLLAEELAGGLHALALVTPAPAEDDPGPATA